MFRTQSPKNQVALIEKFVDTELQANAPHNKVLELVAHLNGAPTWNALSGASKDSPACLAVKSLLPSLSALNLAPKFVKNLRQTHQPLPQVMLESLFQVTVSGLPADADESALTSACVHLSQLQEAAKVLEDLIWKRIGFNRERVLKAGMLPVEIRTTMFDDEAGFELIVLDEALKNLGFDDELQAMASHFYVPIPYSVMEQLQQEGTVSRMFVSYPRSDRYGVPEEATTAGGQEWLWSMGFAITPSVEIECEDSGDDSMASCEIQLYITPDLLGQLITACKDSVSSKV